MNGKIEDFQKITLKQRVGFQPYVDVETSFDFCSGGKLVVERLV